MDDTRETRKQMFLINVPPLASQLNVHDVRDLNETERKQRGVIGHTDEPRKLLDEKFPIVFSLIPRA